MEENYYRVLGVTDFTDDLTEIKSAYRKQIRYYHPDNHNVPPEVAKEKAMLLNQAYEVLSDVDKKKEYDFELRFLQEEMRGSASEDEAKQDEYYKKESNKQEMYSHHHMPGKKKILRSSILGLIYVVLTCLDFPVHFNLLDIMSILYLIAHGIASILGIIHCNHADKVTLLYTVGITDLFVFMSVMILEICLGHLGFVEILIIGVGLFFRLQYLVGAKSNSAFYRPTN